MSTKGKLTYVKGDVTEPQRNDPAEVIVLPHVCNNIDGWGRGVVVAISNKWPEPEREYRDYMNSSTTQASASRGLGETIRVEVADNIVVMNMIAQNGVRGKDNPIPLRYPALVKTMEYVALDIIRMKGQGKQVSIACPKFGAGLAGGDWRVIEALIRQCWCDYGIDVTVYEFE